MRSVEGTRNTEPILRDSGSQRDKVRDPLIWSDPGVKWLHFMSAGRGVHTSVLSSERLLLV